MKALSVRGDYVMDMITGKKKIEYRTWYTKYRGDLLMCSTADVLKAIKYAIDHTSGVSPQILFEFYVLHKKVWEINRDCNMNHNQFGDFKNVALNQFAECWISAQDKYFPDEADRFDLQIYPGETLADAGWRADQTTRKRKNGM